MGKIDREIKDKLKSDGLVISNNELKLHLKEFNGFRDKLTKTLRSINEEKHVYDDFFNFIKESSRIEKEQSKGIEITDHAVLRYLERKVGFSKSKIIEDLVPITILNSLHKNNGTGTFHTANELSIVFKDYKIITVIPRKNPNP